MHPRSAITIALGLLACDDPTTVDPTRHPCADDVASLDVAPPRDDFGALEEDPALWCGNPPQGGAPYSPLRVRVRGPEALADGMLVEVFASDATTGEALGSTALSTRMTCANVGDSAGFWVGSEVHMLYAGFGLDDLDGRLAELTVRITSVDETVVIEDHWPVDLVLD